MSLTMDFMHYRKLVARARATNPLYGAVPSDRRGRPRKGYQVAIDGCWEYQGYRDRDGYGFVNTRDYEPGTGRLVKKSTQMAHRYFYELWVGVSLPRHLELDHRCRNRACIRPTHLDVVTHIVNMERATMNGSFNRRSNKGDSDGAGARVLHVAMEEGRRGCEVVSVRAPVRRPRRGRVYGRAGRRRSVAASR